jgi:hypothetical protein
MRTLALSAVAATLLLAACGDSASTLGTSDPSTSPPATADRDAPTVLVSSFGGDQLVESAFRAQPQVAAFADGRVVVPGAVPAIYPGPALYPFFVHAAGAAAVADVAEQADEAGVGSADTGTAPNAGSTRITVQQADGRVLTSDVDGLYVEPGGLSAAQQSARQRIRAWLDRVVALADGPGEAYSPEAVAVLARDYDTVLEDRGGEGLPQSPIAWRGPDPAGGESFYDGRCLVVSGAALDAVRPDLQRSNELTPWTVGAERYHFALRALLPHEKDCGDLMPPS